MSRSPFNPPPLIALCQLPAGAIGRVRELTGDTDFCQRVREMGFGESAFVTKVSGNGPILCQVAGTRIALSHEAANKMDDELMLRTAQRFIQMQTKPRV